jgi:hypothetical protein
MSSSCRTLVALLPHIVQYDVSYIRPHAMYMGPDSQEHCSMALWEY